MKKEFKKRLQLNKTTVANLSEKGMTRVLGGATAFGLSCEKTLCMPECDSEASLCPPWNTCPLNC
jgi:hypothetical protein